MGKRIRQSQQDTTSYPLGQLLLKKKTKTKSGKQTVPAKTQRLASCAVPVGRADGGATEGPAPQKLKPELPCGPAIPPLGVPPEAAKTRPVSITAITIHNSQTADTTRRPPTRERITQVVCTADHYSALKRKEILTQATACMHLGDVISEISRSQNNKYCMVLLIRRCLE